MYLENVHIQRIGCPQSFVTMMTFEMFRFLVRHQHTLIIKRTITIVAKGFQFPFLPATHDGAITHTHTPIIMECVFVTQDRKCHTPSTAILTHCETTLSLYFPHSGDGLLGLGTWEWSWSSFWAQNHSKRHSHIAIIN